MRRRQQGFASLIALGGALTPAAPPPATPPPVITIDAHDFAFALPDRVPAGVVTFRLANHGREPHHAQIARLEEGKTAGDFVRAFTDTSSMPAWVRYVGGPVGTAHGQEHSATLRLTPGRYVVVCRIISPDGRVHVMKGMIREFQVEARRGGASATAFPVASDTVTLNDYGFISRRPLAAGHHTVRVENAGPQPPAVVMLALKPGKVPADFARWGLAGRHGPPPCRERCRQQHPSDPADFSPLRTRSV